MQVLFFLRIFQDENYACSIDAVYGDAVMKFFLPGLGDQNNVLKCPKSSAMQCMTGALSDRNYESFDYRFRDAPRPSAMYQVKLSGNRNFAMLFSGKDDKFLFYLTILV